MVSLPINEKQEPRTFHSHGVQLTEYHDHMSRPRLSRPHRILVVVLPLVLLAWLLMSHLSFDPSDLARSTVTKHHSYHNAAHPAQAASTLKGNSSALVPLEAHIMSKCPDARDCLRDLVVPAMEKVVDMVDFNLSFIGK